MLLFASKKEENKIKKLIIKIYIYIFLIIVPLITISMNYIGFIYLKSEQDKSNYVILKVLPIYLKVWIITLIMAVIFAGLFRKKYPMYSISSTRNIIFFSLSFSLFIVFCFIDLFAMSLLLGGFHAS